MLREHALILEPGLQAMRQQSGGQGTIATASF
jgi:hypothetical protein